MASLSERGSPYVVLDPAVSPPSLNDSKLLDYVKGVKDPARGAYIASIPPVIWEWRSKVRDGESHTIIDELPLRPVLPCPEYAFELWKWSKGTYTMDDIKDSLGKSRNCYS